MLHLFLWFAQHYVPEVASAVAEPPAPIHRSDNMIDRLTPKLKDDCFMGQCFINIANLQVLAIKNIRKHSKYLMRII